MSGEGRRVGLVGCWVGWFGWHVVGAPPDRSGGRTGCLRVVVGCVRPSLVLCPFRVLPVSDHLGEVVRGAWCGGRCGDLGRTKEHFNFIVCLYPYIYNKV